MLSLQPVELSIVYTATSRPEGYLSRPSVVLSQIDYHPRRKQQPKAMLFSSQTALSRPDHLNSPKMGMYTYTVGKQNKNKTKCKTKTAKRTRPSYGRAKTPWSWCNCRVAEPSCTCNQDAIVPLYPFVNKV